MTKNNSINWLKLLTAASPAVQFAAVLGLRVVAIDSGEDKRKLVLELGAEKWIDYKESKDLVADIIAATGGGAHAAVITTGTTAVYNQAIGYLRSRATIVVVGLPKDGMLCVPLAYIAGLVSSCLYVVLLESVNMYAFASKGVTIRGVLIGFVKVPLLNCCLLISNGLYIETVNLPRTSSNSPQLAK